MSNWQDEPDQQAIVEEFMTHEKDYVERLKAHYRQGDIVKGQWVNVKEVINHGLVTEDVIVNVWTENKQKIEAEVFYVNANQIEIAVSMDLNNVKTVIIG